MRKGNKLTNKMKIVLNMKLENLQKRNWEMTAYDPNIFQNASELIYRRDGLAKATLKHGQTISQGIYKFETPDLGAVTINLFDYLEKCPRLSARARGFRKVHHG